MEAPRRRGPTGGTSSTILIRAVAVGMFCGLIISGAMFYHKLRLQTLQAELSNDINYLEDRAEAEQHKRELAEQLQGEADTERSKIQSQLQDMSGSILAANQAKQKAEEAGKEAEDGRKRAEAKAAELQQQIEQLESKLKNAAGQNQAFRAFEADSRHMPWEPSRERDAEDPELAAILRKVAKNNEVIVAISNANYAKPGGFLESWMRTVKGAQISNVLVVALDEETKEIAESSDIASLVMDLKIPESQKDVGPNHAVSGLKFKILLRFLKLGYAVLLSDVDIIFLQDPFPHLYKDSDVEAMSDGWDNRTAYGYDDVADDPSMGWARYAHSMRVFCFNSGLFYIRPTEASVLLLRKVMHRIETEAGWDQALFNEVIFFPSHHDQLEPAVTRRVMDYYKFMNSKVLFKEVRYKKRLKSQLPVSVHANYHNNKAERLEAAEAFWIRGDDELLMSQKEGS